MPGRLSDFIAQLAPLQLLTRFQMFPFRRSESIARSHDDCDWQVLRHLIPAGTHVVDVGASLGGTARGLAELVTDSGRVTAVEALPALHALLQSNVRKLALRHVETECCAVSSSPGTVKLLVTEADPDGGHLLTARVGLAPGEGETATEVPSRTLDQMFASRRPAVELIHLDIAGHALSALRGAAELLRKVKPVWWLRVDGPPDDRLSPMHEVFRLFAHRGYRAFCFNGERLHRWEADDGERAAHAFFLTERHLKRLPARWVDSPAEPARAAA